MIRTPFALLLLACAAPAAPVPPDSTPRDREGNPLPKGATARLGSLAFTGELHFSLAFSGDGKQVLGTTRTGFVGWDAATGKRLAKEASPLVAREPDSGPQQSGNYFVIPSHRTVGFGKESKVNVTVLDTLGKEVARFDIDPKLYGSGRTHLVTPNGKRFALLPAPTDKPCKLHVFDLPAGTLRHTHELDEGWWRLQVSPDSKVLFLPTRRFDLDTGKELPPLPTLTEKGGPVAPQLQNGTTGIYARPGEWLVYDLGTGKQTGKLKFDGPAPTPQLFAGSRTVIATTTRHPTGAVRQSFSLSRWNLDTGKREWEAPAPAFTPVLSPDGKRLAISCGWRVALYDTTTGARLDTNAGHNGGVKWIGFSGDGTTVTTFGTRDVAVWALNGERKLARDLPELVLQRDNYLAPGCPQVWKARVGKDRWEAVGWDFDRHEIGWRRPLGTDLTVDRVRLLSPDGKRVVAAVWSGDVANVFAYDAVAGERLGKWALPSERRIVGVSSDGRTVFARRMIPDNGLVRDGPIVGLDALSGKETVLAKPTERRGTLSGDGTQYAILSWRDARQPATVQVYDTKTGDEVVSIEVGLVDANIATAYYDVSFLDFSPNGKQLAVRAGEQVLLCDVARGARPRTLNAGAYATCTAFSPNGAQLAVGYADGTALIWDVTAKPKE